MPPITDKKELNIFRLFEVSVVLKGINAALEIIFGGLLLFFNVGDIVRALAVYALVEDPDSFLATHLFGFVSSFSPQAELYSALYLLSPGIIKIFLVVGL